MPRKQTRDRDPERSHQGLNQHTSGWRAEQLDEVFKYFSTQMTMMTLYQKVNKHNPPHSWEAICRQVRRYRKRGLLKPREEACQNLRRGFLDIETTHLKANFGLMLCWYIKPEAEENPAKFDYAVIKRRELLSGTRDKRVVKTLLKALGKYDEVWTHYGRRFDVPFINTRALFWEIEDQLPKNGEKFLKDTWEIARKRIALHSNRLDAIGDALGIVDIEKTRLKPKTWQDAQYGDEDAIHYIANHCEHDVILLQRVFERLVALDRTPMRTM